MAAMLEAAAVKSKIRSNEKDHVEGEILDYFSLSGFQHLNDVDAFELIKLGGFFCLVDIIFKLFSFFFSEVHAVIAMLIQQLEAGIKHFGKAAEQSQNLWNDSKKAQTAVANGARDNARNAVKRRDAEKANADKAKALALKIDSEIGALQQTLNGLRRSRKAAHAQCTFEKKAGQQEQDATLRQIRVLTQALAMLKTHQNMQQIVSMIKGIKLDVSVWQLGTWSKCSKLCGLGKQYRSVSCTGQKCMSAKPRTERVCSLGPCKADCILSPWSAWSACSSQCGRGVQESTRKILARELHGGQTCPSSLGLQQKRACNQQECTVEKGCSQLTGGYWPLQAHHHNGVVRVEANTVHTIVPGFQPGTGSITDDKCSITVIYPGAGSNSAKWDATQHRLVWATGDVWVRQSRQVCVFSLK
jgi:hypothetical protein